MPSHMESMPIGTVIASALTETTIQYNYGTGWILCDGRNVAGSKYASMTGFTTVPDLRGRYVRGKDNGSGNDPNGDSPIGTYRADQNLLHDHSFTKYDHSLGGGTGVESTNNLANAATVTTSAAGGPDVQVRSIVLYWHIKIN